MSKDWFADISDMHDHYGFTERFAALDEEKRAACLKFRADFIREELRELYADIDSPEDVVDALIDICVVAIGTLHAFGIDGHRAWDEVHRANMAKETGVKESRPNPLGLPDLVKPIDFVSPSHMGNHGRLPTIKTSMGDQSNKI